MRYDLAIVGAGILGLGHALAASRRGLKVVVIDRETEAVGASVRNFGFVTVTGQQQGDCYRRAMRSRDVWEEVAPKAGIPVEHQGLLVVAQRPEAMDCLEAFARTEMGQGCHLLTAEQTMAQHGAVLSGKPIQGALWSSHERRVESRFAIPKLAAWIQSLGVTFLRKTLVKEVQKGRVLTTSGVIEATQVVVCPGDDMLTLYPEVIARHQVNIFYTAPTAIRAFMKSGRDVPDQYDMRSLRILGTVGEPINPEAWMWYRDVIGGDRCVVP